MTDPDLPRSTPMCDRWYERAGDYRPWHTEAGGCTCSANAHALPEQHQVTCPVYQQWNRQELLVMLISGEPEG